MSIAQPPGTMASAPVRFGIRAPALARARNVTLAWVLTRIGGVEAHGPRRRFPGGFGKRSVPKPRFQTGPRRAVTNNCCEGASPLAHPF